MLKKNSKRKPTPSNFKNDRELASRAGKISAWKRNGGKLKDMPVFFEYSDEEV